MELTLDQALQKGIEAHKAGKAEEADRHYTAILKVNPEHSDANHNMGVLAVGVGKVETALPFFKTALETNSNIAQYWLSYIDALIKLDRMTEAQEVFDQAKGNGVNGDRFEQIEKLLGPSEYEGVNVQELPQEHLNSLITLFNQNRLQEVFNKARKLTKRYTSSPVLWNLMGVSAAQLGQLGDAIEAYKKALSVKPDFADAHYNMGNVLQDQGKLDEAIVAFDNALSIKPDYADAYNNMGNALKEQDKLDEAIAAFGNALSIKPDYAYAYYNMGKALKDQGKLDEAIEAYSKALSIEPEYVDAYNNMGLALQDQGKPYEAIEAYNKALSIKPEYANAYYNMSFLKLQTEEWKQGIDLREWRWKTKHFQAYERFFEAPKWDGKSPLDGKTLLVWGEQGPGDIIIWCACLNYYTSIGAKVIVECPQKLVRLLTNSFPTIMVRGENKDLENTIEDFDFQIPMETLFGHACLSGQITNQQNEYIFPDQSRVMYWKDRLKKVTEKPCIGISWKSPLMNRIRQNNYVDLSFWKPLLKNQNYTFFNLQSLDFHDDLQKITRDFGIEVINFDDLDHYDDLAEVAAFCKALDKSISVATAVATISAAVGTHTIIPTWKQGSWNSILLNSRGPKVERFYRNTWESWDRTLSEISGVIL